MTKLFYEGAWSGAIFAFTMLILLWLFDAQVFIECGADPFLGG